MVDVCKFEAHRKFVTPMFTLEILYLCKIEYCKFATLTSIREPLCSLHGDANVDPWIVVSLYGYRFVTPTSTLEFLYLCKVDFASFQDAVSL